MSTEQKIERRYGAIVVGGGQAGLSASYWLARAGVDHVVFEKKSIMHKWREERWDTFCLVTRTGNASCRDTLMKDPIPTASW
jgi:putative flavoprotein involved in K+ transport